MLSHPPAHHLRLPHTLAHLPHHVQPPNLCHLVLHQSRLKLRHPCPPRILSLSLDPPNHNLKAPARDPHHQQRPSPPHPGVDLESHTAARPSLSLLRPPATAPLQPTVRRPTRTRQTLAATTTRTTTLRRCSSRNSLGSRARLEPLLLWAMVRGQQQDLQRTGWEGREQVLPEDRLERSGLRGWARRQRV